MNAALTLDASAEALLICGDEIGAAICQQMARTARDMDKVFGPGAGDALHRVPASELAERASLKLAAFNLERRVG